MITIQNKFVIVVFRGEFNPSIYHPIWFSKNGLLSEQEAEKAELKVIIPDISDFSTDWFNLQVTRDRFLIKTSQESHFDAIGDLIIGTFTLLKHTPLRQLGINFEGNVRMRDEESWHKYGHKLAPKDIWSKKLKEPGMNQIQMKCKRNDNFKGYVMVTVKPAQDIEYGVNFHINDHYENDDTNKFVDSNYLIEVFKKERNESIARSIDIVNTLMEEV